MVSEDGSFNSFHMPNLDTREPKQLLMPWKLWGQQTIYRLNGKNISRMQIVLGAANKDGGAHVDERLTPEYAALRDGVVNIFFHMDEKEVGGPVPYGHLCDLRQMGHEILTTPQLLEFL
jgi:hypothetical protein